MISQRELEELSGNKIDAKVEFFLWGERLFHREDKSTFYEYDTRSADPNAQESNGAGMEPEEPS